MGIPADTQALITELLDWFETWPRNVGALRGDLRMTGALHPYDFLFSSIAVGRINLKNRLVMGPMGNLSISALERSGLSALAEEQRVAVDVTEGHRGPEAVRVRLT